jgi:murein DD-endopeptidase MepM/ murein hydrolase activator NlpD
MKRFGQLLVGWALAAAVVACAPTPLATPAPPGTAVPPTASATLPSLPSATVSATVTPTSQPTFTPTSIPAACSPLQGVALVDLDKADILKGTFEAPRPGYDDGHHGLDFAYWSDAQGKPMLGLPVHSVLAGRVAAVLPDRQPYGNAVIIETSLNGLPPGWKEQLPAYEFSLQPAISLECPPYEFTPPSQESSLYLLYGHLNQASSLELGDKVACGQTVGEVGTSGRSVNPHLHLEFRLGPSGTVFPVMGHYTNDTTTEERRQYCLWRVSGAFLPFDPLPFLVP